MDLTRVISLVCLLVCGRRAEGNSVRKVSNIENDTDLDEMITAANVLMYSLPW